MSIRLLSIVTVLSVYKPSDRHETVDRDSPLHQVSKLQMSEGETILLPILLCLSKEDRQGHRRISRSSCCRERKRQEAGQEGRNCKLVLLQSGAVTERMSHFTSQECRSSVILHERRRSARISRFARGLHLHFFRVQFRCRSTAQCPSSA